MIRTVSKKAELTEPLFCNRCGAILVEGSGTFYRVNIEAVADPAPPIISSEDLAKDPSEEIKKLLMSFEPSVRHVFSHCFQLVSFLA